MNSYDVAVVGSLLSLMLLAAFGPILKEAIVFRMNVRRLQQNAEKFPQFVEWLRIQGPLVVWNEDRSTGRVAFAPAKLFYTPSKNRFAWIPGPQKARLMVPRSVDYLLRYKDEVEWAILMEAADVIPSDIDPELWSQAVQLAFRREDGLYVPPERRDRIASFFQPLVRRWSKSCCCGHEAWSWMLPSLSAMLDQSRT